MKELESLRGIDVYLIDQLLKGRVNSESKILDAGCGSGRNIHYLIENNLNVSGVDANAEVIHQLRENYPKTKHRFHYSTLEDFTSSDRFDFVICNAVLHFARDHEHFSKMFASLISLLSKNGILFIRMTSDIGLDLHQNGRDGVFDLSDGSERYLITRERINELLKEYDLSLIEPVKTVKVEELRSMSTIVLTKH
ncbi:MAG: class I SAM-dependent methyltransferase [Crocinitomicaceae bacterium]|nr:class I SAM-dependent methyltransferase [Crocinitomicaceae bacterium]